MQVKEIMTPGVDFVTMENTLGYAAEKMGHLDIGELPVVDGKAVVGIITDRDIAVRGVAKGLDPRTAKVAEAMTKGVIACAEEDDLMTAAGLMAKNRIRRLPVKDADGNMSGIISLGDLARNIDPSVAGEVLLDISK